MRLLVIAAAALSLPGCAARPPLAPPAPGAAGLSDDGTPVSEASFAPASAQAAASVARTYYALIGARRFAEAWRLLADGAAPRGASAADFAAAFADYAEYHASVGAPGPIEGAAGSSFVEVPVLVYGRMRSGATFSRRGIVQLRRCNDVPGCTAQQRGWRIFAETMGDSP
jgi:hypothetical protein